jgi:hypothetical protein
MIVPTCLQGDGGAIDTHMRGLISHHHLEDTFFVLDLGAVQRQYSAWVEAMPRVRPFYEVRCVPAWLPPITRAPFLALALQAAVCFCASIQECRSA